GQPFYMESFIGGFEHPCDFWHSHEPVSGGTIYDWGSHYFDWILQLFDPRVVSVAAQAHKRVWHDVTNADQVRVDLAFEGGDQVDPARRRAAERVTVGTPLPGPLPPGEREVRIGWGILGAADIARKAVLPAIAASTNGRVVALASRSTDRARQMLAPYAGA